MFIKVILWIKFNSAIRRSRLQQHTQSDTYDIVSGAATVHIGLIAFDPFIASQYWTC